MTGPQRLVDMSSTVVAYVDWSALIIFVRIAITAVPRPAPQQTRSTEYNVDRHRVVAVNDHDGAHVHGAVEGDVSVNPSQSVS